MYNVSMFINYRVHLHYTSMINYPVCKINPVSHLTGASVYNNIGHTKLITLVSTMAFNVSNACVVRKTVLLTRGYYRPVVPDLINHSHGCCKSLKWTSHWYHMTAIRVTSPTMFHPQVHRLHRNQFKAKPR